MTLEDVLAFVYDARDLLHVRDRGRAGGQGVREGFRPPGHPRGRDETGRGRASHGHPVGDPGRGAQRAVRRVVAGRVERGDGADEFGSEYLDCGAQLHDPGGARGRGPVRARFGAKRRQALGNPGKCRIGHEVGRSEHRSQCDPRGATMHEGR